MAGSGAIYSPRNDETTSTNIVESLRKKKWTSSQRYTSVEYPNRPEISKEWRWVGVGLKKRIHNFGSTLQPEVRQENRFLDAEQPQEL